MKSADRKVWLQPYTHLKTMTFGILAFDFVSGKTNQIATEFEVHNIFYDEDGEEFIAVNSYGNRYLKFKDVSFRGLKNYFVKDKFLLAGHVASKPADPKFYMTGIVQATGESCILMLDKKSGEFELGSLLGSAEPPAHDCKFGYNSEEFITTSNKSIHFFNAKNRILKSKEVELFSSESVLRHFSVSHENEICLQSNIISKRNPVRTYKDAQITFYSKGNISSFMAEATAKSLKNAELLDFSFANKGKIFAVVHGETPFLTVWDSSPLAPVKTLKFEENLSRVSEFFGEPYFLVLGLENFYLVDMRTFAIKKVHHFQQRLSRHYQYSHQTLFTG